MTQLITQLFSWTGQLADSPRREQRGGFLSRLSHMADNVTNEILNSRVRKSQIEDTDVASEVAEFSKREILKQTSIAMLTQINRKGSELLELLN